MVGSVGEFAEHLDFVGRFDHLQDDAVALLKRLNMWEDYGASGWGFDGTAAIFAVNDADNRTGARAQVERFLSAQQQDQVRQAYHMDYALFERLGLHDMAEASQAYR